MNSTSKNKLQSKVGCTLSGSQTGAAATMTTGIDRGLDSVKSTAAVAANNLAEPTSSGESPDLLSSSDALGHAFLFSPRPGANVISDGVRPLATTSLHHAGAARPRSWEAEHPAVSPHDLQVNRESPMFYHHSQDAHIGLPSSHLPLPVGLSERSQRSPLGIMATPDSYSTLHTAFQLGDAASPSSTCTAGMEVQSQSVRSRGPSHACLPTTVGLLQTRYSHLDHVSESLALASAYTNLGRPLCDLGPTVTAMAATAATASHIHRDARPLIDPNHLTPQLGPSTAPIPSLYWLLFDMDCDSIDRTRDGDMSSLSPPKLPSGDDTNAIASALLPQAGSVTPTPISFIAKWEDMLALERRICSSSSPHDNNENAAANLPPHTSKHVPEAQTQQTHIHTHTHTHTRPHTQAQAVEINRTNRDGRELPT
jgi:hypothetical protein